MSDRLKVLCVDDSIWSAADLLSLSGCDVRYCHNAHSAQAEAAAFQPDVCVLDLSLFGDQESVGKLQERAGRRLRLIALAGEEDGHFPSPWFERHLAKPADPQLVVEAVTGEELILV